MIEGDPKNIKITTKEDLKTPLCGIGYDIHRFKNGNGIKLMATFIPCEFSFVAHSDGDVALHALMDAMLSAIGEKDIGHLFPVDDKNTTTRTVRTFFARCWAKFPKKVWTCKTYRLP